MSCLQEKQNETFVKHIWLAPLLVYQEANFLKSYALECSWSHQNHIEDVKRESFQSYKLSIKKETSFKQNATKKASFSSTTHKIPRTHTLRREKWKLLKHSRRETFK